MAICVPKNARFLSKVHEDRSLQIVRIKKLLAYSLSLFLFSCSSDKERADLLIHHAKIYTLDSSFSFADAIVIREGKIIYVGSEGQARDEYEVPEIYDADGGTIFPGFIDAHCHYYGYGKGLNELDLVGTNSINEVLRKLKEFANEHHLFPEKSNIDISGTNWIIGRGWDQNDWTDKAFPDRDQLDSLFPNVPVLLKRIDGHAVLVNACALNLAGFTERTRINGGETIIKNGKLSGILVDNAADSLEKCIPGKDKKDIIRALLSAQDSCLRYGLTTVDDAGLEKSVVDAVDELQKSGQLKIRMYAMLSPTEENLKHFLENGIYTTDRLTVRSFKFYADGALGSRGACLKKDYEDKKGWKGFLLNFVPYYENHAKLMAKKGFQMNTHSIGDSSAAVLLRIYSSYTKGKDLRWRIEHAQVVEEKDQEFFKDGIIPSVQPTHATSDMYWVAERLGKEREKNAYAYKSLLQKAGKVALGTDFPVEHISPFKTFYAAVVRKDARDFPAGGYQPSNALSRPEAMKGMTIWAAYANFEEKEKGSIEKGKFADLVVLDTDLMTCKPGDILKTKVKATFINGEKVYDEGGRSEK